MHKINKNIQFQKQHVVSDHTNTIDLVVKAYKELWPGIIQLLYVKTIAANKSIRDFSPIYLIFMMQKRMDKVSAWQLGV